ncbi:PAS domain S-box protein [Sporosarcina sp. ANT_H38]|uniref:PAS domain-containing sensor histidine kinase n=1 Tax=Sporosarcina sp. ANT_H38 TaxID=2597358 RepID=UPI0011F0BE02|nr:PAS domain-containing sensor histidine kinase [Sporosarcina sp. ANT_H38]KAA0965221.1 PAS domain S-box protein [Sporosarcina sp. ANT_H38]
MPNSCVLHEDKGLMTGNAYVEKLIFSLTKSGVILNASRDFCTISVEKIPSIIGTSIYEFVHEDDRPLFIERINESYGASLIPFTFRFTKSKWSFLPFYVNMCSWISHNEVHIQAIPIFETSAYTSVERALIDKEITVFDITDGAAINYTFDGTVTGVNDAYVELFGWTKEELEGKEASIIPDFLLYEFIEIKERLENGEKVVQLNTVRITKNGLMLPVNIKVLADYDDDGMVRSVFALLRKLEETLEMKAFVEKQLGNILQQEVLIKDITRNSEFGICQFDVEKGMYLYVSPGIERLIGIPVLDLMKDPALFVSTCHPDDKIELFRFYEELSKETTEIEYRVVNKDEKICWIRTKITPVIDGVGEVMRYVSITQDISKLKMQDELLRKWDMLHIVGQLSASFAHQVRNPLTTIKGFIQLLPMGPENTFGSIMTEELSKIELIIEEFLQLAKPSNGTGFTTTSIYNEITRTIALMEKEAMLNNISFNMKLNAKDQFIHCESKQIQQVFINLMKNSIDAMPNGGVITISTVAAEGRVVKVTLSDTGIGIPPERLSKLGEPYYSLKEKGTGLGLMVSYKIIENHHGSIQFKSKEGFGTTVEISLPISVPAS